MHVSIFASPWQRCGTEARDTKFDVTRGGTLNIPRILAGDNAKAVTCAHRSSTGSRRNMTAGHSHYHGAGPGIRFNFPPQGSPTGILRRRPPVFDAGGADVF